MINGKQEFKLLNMKTIKFILFLGIIISFSACNKNELTDITPNDEVTLDDLNVSSDFNWQTYETYDLTLESKLNSLVKILSGDKIIHQVFLAKNESYKTKIAMPTYANFVTLKHLGKEITLELDSPNLIHTFN